MPNRTVAVELRALVSNYVAGMRQAGQATAEFASKAQKHIQASKGEISDLSTKATVAGGVLIAGVAAIGKTYADFDRQMSAVAATGDDAKASLDGLRGAALAAGKDTAFSATEAAQGVENLLKAGVKAADVMGGALSGALSLAAAGEVSVADAAETAAMAMTQFKLAGSDVGHIADLLAAGAGKAQGEVSDLSMGLRQSGLVAAQFGLNIEDTIGTLSAFANAGLIGSDAGTSFKTMLLSLANPATKTRKLMDELGISAYDAEGGFVGVTGLAEQLKSKLGGLTQAQRDQAMAQIFGNDAIRAANVLYDLGADGLQQVIDQTDDAGYAAQVAATRMDNLAGDWEKFTGSVETAALRSGSGLNDYLRDLTQSATGVVDAIGELPVPVLESTVRIAALTGGALLAVGAFGKVTVGLSNTIASFTALKTQAPKTATAVAALGKAALIAGAAFAAVEILAVFGRVQQDAIDGTYASLADVDVVLASIGAPGGGLDQVDDLFGKVQNKFLAWQTGEAAVTGVGDAIKRVSDASRLFFGGDDSQVSRMVAGWFGTKTAVAELEDQIVKTDQALAAMDSKRAAEAFTAIREAAVDSGVGLEDLVARFPEYKATLQSVVAELGIAEPSLQEYADWMGGKVPDAVREATAAHPELIDRMSDTQKGAAGEARSLSDLAKSASVTAKAILALSGSQIGMEAAIDDAAAAAKKNGATLDTNTAKGRANQSALDNLAAATLTYRDTLIEQGKSSDEIAAATERGRKKWVESATAMGMSKKKAKELADELFDIPADVKAEIKATFDAKGVAEANAALNKIDGKTVQTYIDTYNRQRTGGPKLADGGMVEHFASGGTREPQVRPFQGDAGVNWGEQGSGPWEAFISGAPQKKERSLAIWREVGRRLGASEALAAAFADGGISMPTHKGKDLSYWQGKLLSPLELTQLQIQIRDLKADLAATETYNPPGKKKKAKRDKLRGLDRIEAQQRLADATAELADAQEAARLNAARAGTIEQRLATYQDASDRYSQAQSVSAGVQGRLGGFDLGSALAGTSSWTRHTDAAGNAWYSGAQEQASAASITAKATARAAKARSFLDKLSQLRQAGMSAAVLNDIASLGAEEGIPVADAYLADTSQIAGLNSAYADLEQNSTAAGDFVAGVVDGLDGHMAPLGASLADAFTAALAGSGTVLPARASGGPVKAGELYQVNELGWEAFRPAVDGFVLSHDAAAREVRNSTNLPGYMTSGAVMNVTETHGPTIDYHPTYNYPQAEPAAVAQNRDLAYAAALGGL